MTSSDPDSFDESFDDLARIAYRVAYRLLGDRAEAEDVVQETLARAFARWRRVRAYAEPWVTRVATNLAIDVHRRRRPAPDAPRITTEELATVSRLALVGELSRLPQRQREVIVLRYLADRPEAEVAVTLGVSAGSVKRHAHRGLAALRLALDLPTPQEP